MTVNLADVDEAPKENVPPQFHEGESTTRQVAENSAGGIKVGAPVTATNPDGDSLSYSLSGSVAASFAIGSTGQIATVADVTYGYEAKSAYSLTVDGVDGGGLGTSVAVTVNLTDVDETTTGDGGRASGDGGTEEKTTPTAVSECFTAIGALSAKAEYAGQWNDADCKAQHQDSRGRYFHFNVDANKQVTITLWFRLKIDDDHDSITFDF